MIREVVFQKSDCERASKPSWIIPILDELVGMFVAASEGGFHCNVISIPTDALGEPVVLAGGGAHGSFW